MLSVWVRFDGYLKSHYFKCDSSVQDEKGLETKLSFRSSSDFETISNADSKQNLSVF